MRRVRSILLTIAAFIGGFIATQLVIYGVFCIIAWRTSDRSISAGEAIGYLYLGWNLFIGLPVSLGVGVLAASFVPRNRASMTP